MMSEFLADDLTRSGFEASSLRVSYTDALSSALSSSQPPAVPADGSQPVLCKLSPRVEVRDAVFLVLAADWNHAGWAAAQTWPGGMSIGVESSASATQAVAASTAPDCKDFGTARRQQVEASRAEGQQYVRRALNDAGNEGPARFLEPDTAEATVTGLIRRPPRSVRSPSDRGRADDGGLISLEWLLIVAAVIAMSTVTVSAVNKTIFDRSEDLSGSTVRKQSATTEARQIVLDAHRDFQWQPKIAAKYAGWVPYYESLCVGLGTIYEDVGLLTSPVFRHIGSNRAEVVKRVEIVTSESPFDTVTSQDWRGRNYAHCGVTFLE